MFDLVLSGGSILDGSGGPAFRADVAVTSDRIVAVGRHRDELAKRVVDATGLTIAPGFIDMHSHSDLQILANPAHEAKVRQGVTLDVLGQDGLSYAPVDDNVLADLRRQLRGWNGDPAGFDWNWRTVGEYLDRLDTGIAINAAYLVPHGTLRMMVMGLEDRAASSAELGSMQRLLGTGMEEGALGMSAGLSYPPAMYADNEELIALCRVVAAYGGYYCPHHRNYGSHALESYAECLDIAKQSGVALHLAHAHLGFEVNRGRAAELLGMIDAAIAEGVDVSLDSYPYLAGSTYLHAILPGWYQSGGSTATLERLRDESLRERLRIELEESGSDGFQGVPILWDKVVISGVSLAHNRHLVGESLEDAARAVGKRPVDFLCELLVEEDLGVTCLEHIGNEENVRLIMTHPAHMVGSDGILVGGRPHPRAWGTFPRYLALYARQLGVISTEQAIRKMTALPARRLGLTDRGLVRPGMAADLVCLDLDRVSDSATYEDPCRPPEGIPWVIVNGVPVVENDRHTGRLPGRSIRRRRTRAVEKLPLLQ